MWIKNNTKTSEFVSNGRIENEKEYNKNNTNTKLATMKCTKYRITIWVIFFFISFVYTMYFILNVFIFIFRCYSILDWYIDLVRAYCSLSLLNGEAVAADCAWCILWSQRWSFDNEKCDAIINDIAHLSRLFSSFSLPFLHIHSVAALYLSTWFRRICLTLYWIQGTRRHRFFHRK